MITYLGALPEEGRFEEGTAEDYLNHGLNFCESARVLNQNAQSLGPHRFASTYFCVAHSYELLLKALLLNHGYTHKQLREPQIRHDLEALLNEAKKHGLEISYDHEYEIAQLNKYCKKHEFRYPFMGGKFPGDKDLLIDISRSLHAQILELMRSLERVANG